MPERAEIEAVAEVLEGATSLFPNPPHAARYYAEKAIVALDRVRDARGDDENAPRCEYEGFGVRCCRPYGHLGPHENAPAAWSPQSEDHEAERLREERNHALDDIELLRAVNARLVKELDQARINAACAGEMADQAEAALSRVSPPREARATPSAGAPSNAPSANAPPPSSAPESAHGSTA